MARAALVFSSVTSSAPPAVLSTAPSAHALAAGEHLLPLPTAGFGSSAYVVHVEVGAGAVARTFTLTR